MYGNVVRVWRPFPKTFRLIICTNRCHEIAVHISLLDHKAFVVDTWMAYPFATKAFYDLPIRDECFSRETVIKAFVANGYVIKAFVANVFSTTNIYNRSRRMLLKKRPSWRMLSTLKVLKPLRGEWFEILPVCDEWANWTLHSWRMGRLLLTLRDERLNNNLLWSLRHECFSI